MAYCLFLARVVKFSPECSEGENFTTRAKSHVINIINIQGQIIINKNNYITYVTLTQ